jgi:hypothetical protein
MLKKVVYAGAQATSFVQATKALEALAERAVSRERVQRWTKRVGEERDAEAGQQAAAYQALPLPERRRSPHDQVPQVACVEMDGGRLQIRQRLGQHATEDRSSGYWRESLVGCLLSMTSLEHESDPCPSIPSTFVDPQRMSDLCREIKGFSATAETAEAPADPARSERDGQPKILVRSVIATRRGSEEFGERLVAAAHRRGFHAAGRKVFLGDGSKSNWALHQQHFSLYTPVLDFTHALCYVYQAAMTGNSPSSGWRLYLRWAQWLWEGNTAALIAAVMARQVELGMPQESDGDTSPRQIVATTLGYLRNQCSRMQYAEYRRRGLPITSSHVESTIKQINRRVKGTDKFWDRGAEPLLQLAADHLSETHDFRDYWKNRPQHLHCMRHRAAV